MTAFMALVRKQLADSRWLLGVTAVALFGLSWVFVWATDRLEARARRDTDPVASMRSSIGRHAFAKALGGPSADTSSTSLEVMFWRHPLVILIAALWPISRGSIGVAGELERGMLDLVLSRPVSRWSYLITQLTSATIGLIVLGLAMLAGNQVGTYYNRIEAPPGMLVLLKPVVNLLALAFSMYGVTLLLSTLDLVRWRPTLIASSLALACYIAQVIANIPSLDNWKWLEHVSIFTAYDPVEAALQGHNLAFNAGILGAIGLTGVVLGLVVFQARDLPTSG